MSVHQVTLIYSNTMIGTLALEGWVVTFGITGGLKQWSVYQLQIMRYVTEKKSRPIYVPEILMKYSNINAFH